MVYVFIDCFVGIWEVSAFPSQTAFQYVPLMQIRWRQTEIYNSLALRELGCLLYLFITKSCENSLVCLEPYSTASIASTSLEEFCVTEIWLRWPAAM